jgi:chromosome segregation ATPase
MRSTSLLRVLGVLTIGCASALGVAAQDMNPPPAADPMADAARKARADEKKEAKPKKVYTNDDFASAPAKPTDPKDATATGAAKDDKELAADNDPKTEAYWRKRFKKVRDKLAQSEQELDVLQRQLDKNEVQYYPDPQKALMQQYTREDINKDRAKLDAKKKEVADLKQQISDMEDELRKAGGDSGWAR